MGEARRQEEIPEETSEGRGGEGRGRGGGRRAAGEEGAVRRWEVRWGIRGSGTGISEKLWRERRGQGWVIPGFTRAIGELDRLTEILSKKKQKSNGL
jgi:hypothetical protein